MINYVWLAVQNGLVLFASQMGSNGPIWSIASMAEQGQFFLSSEIMRLFFWHGSCFLLRRKRNINGFSWKISWTTMDDLEDQGYGILGRQKRTSKDISLEIQQGCPLRANHGRLRKPVGRMPQGILLQNRILRIMAPGIWSRQDATPEYYCK